MSNNRVQYSTFQTLHDRKLKKVSRKKLSDAAGESGEFSKQRVKLNDELEKIKSLIQPLELSKRNIEEQTRYHY